MDIFGFDDAVGNVGFRDNSSGGAAFKFNDTLNLVQQWNVRYQLQVTPLFECGSSKVYFSAKHGQGSCTIGRILSGKGDLTKNIGDVCTPGTGSLTAVSGCSGNSAVTLFMKATILSSVGYSGQAQNAYVSEDVEITFATLSK